MTTTLFRKDPDAVLDYTWDWSAWLASGETITDATVTPSGTGLTVNGTPTTGAATVTAWLTGGTAGTEYLVTCHITTSQGRQDDRTITISVVDR